MKNKNIRSFIIIMLLGMWVNGSIAQGTRPVNRQLTKANMDAIIIDSLQQVINSVAAGRDSMVALYEAEVATNADLRERLIKLDDYRKKLEGNVDSFKGENLKLNQSNRILIVFNSLVAVLLIVSLVFFLRKIGRKKNVPAVTGNNNNTNGRSAEPVKFASFEDKLQQLERLGKLREKELLSEEEFNIEKQRVLGK